MTETGELLTLQGDFNGENNNVYSFNKSLGFSYSLNIDDKEKVEIKTYYPDAGGSEAYQMIFMLKGKAKLRKKGKLSSYVNIGTNQHNLIRVKPQINSMVVTKKDDELICINLNRDFINNCIPQTHPAYKSLTIPSGTNEPAMLFPYNMHITPEISSILQRIGKPSNSQGCFSDQLMLQSKVIELLALQVSQFEQLKTKKDHYQPESEKRERMHMAREILISHTGKQLSLRQLAHLVGTNEFDLKRDFKIVYGNTVYGYLKQYKMEQAKSALIEQNVTVAEISFKMGYKHATHFTSAFKKYFGYLPNKLRAGKILLLVLIQDSSLFFESLDYLAAL